MTDLTEESNYWFLSTKSLGLGIKFGTRHDEKRQGRGWRIGHLWVNCEKVPFCLPGQGQILASGCALPHSRPHLCSAHTAQPYVVALRRDLPDLGAWPGGR